LGFGKQANSLGYHQSQTIQARGSEGLIKKNRRAYQIGEKGEKTEKVIKRGKRLRITLRKGKTKR